MLNLQVAWQNGNIPTDNRHFKNRGRELMKSKLVFFSVIGLVVVCATESLMSMDAENKKGRLNFGLDNDQCIKSYSNQNMDFAVEPSEFLEKYIFDVIPLQPADRGAIICGFCTAIEKQKTVKVPYTFEQKGFVATITALKKKQPAKYNYFVKITASNNNNQ